jgi:hypothetical protein
VSRQKKKDIIYERCSLNFPHQFVSKHIEDAPNPLKNSIRDVKDGNILCRPALGFAGERQIFAEVFKNEKLSERSEIEDSRIPFKKQ